MPAAPRSRFPQFLLSLFSLGIAFLMLAGSPPLQAQEADAAPTAETENENLVLCWYMVCFGNSVERYKQEIQLAQRHGIDGFVLDVGQWNGNKNYIKWTDGIYQAAEELGTGFKLLMAPEYSCQPFVKDVPDMVMRYKDHPNQLRHDGKVVLSGYCSPEMFAPAIAKLEEAGVPVTLITHVFLKRYLYRPSADTYLKMFQENPYVDGLMMFNAGELNAMISDNAAARRATMIDDKIMAAGVIPNYNSANLQDYRGLSGYLAQWQGAINDGADWISIVIWNDYNEDSALNPMRWPPGSERYLYSRDESYLHATAYGSAWFKAKQRPAITQDRFFVTYRNRSKWLRRAWDGNEWRDVSLMNPGRFDQIHDDVQDAVYIDSFLTAPATMTVELGGRTQTFELPGGVGHAQIAMAPGVPKLTLSRDGDTLASVLGRRQILAPDQVNERNSYVGYHHLNRNWASGTAIGPVVKRLEAEAGELGPETTAVTVGDVQAVQTSETVGSGVTWPVDGLEDATYNIRIRYRNTADLDARLTLFADGMGLAEKDFPYFIPAHMPPTGDGFETVSFLWSLSPQTSQLRLLWQDSKMWGQPMEVDYDYGSVQIDAIEFVKLEPIAVPDAADPTTPELVWIPGGSFTMGSDAGEPDEQPTHPVTLSGFAIGKYEITNAQFEAFDPDHAYFRNANSWRDREPVMHVSWVDAAKYCNWLSEQHGLTPVYAEKAPDPEKPNAKFWMTDMAADGFRLPTEAEWEYVATGRGEGRTYPWGDDSPAPGVHGRFGPTTPGPVNPVRTAGEAQGVAPVGSYPAGASRDGVMDLAGNAGEWCSDWYAYPYPATAQTNPINQTPGNYRSIRGGSWSWYGRSQRATDREFNSQNYPGHSYYGLRVVLPEAGYRKLTAKAK